MLKDLWRPEQYNKFKAQRAEPFWDLLHLVQKADRMQTVDLGCGTGELTSELQQQFPGSNVLGIDSSEAMMSEASKFERLNLHFEKQDIQSFAPKRRFDLVFSNAALQWIPNHALIFPRILDWVKPGGQVAIQMPANFDHASHRIALEVAQNFPELVEKPEPVRTLFSQEKYAEILYEAGFHEQKCRLEIYLHPMVSGEDVIEWTKGTLLTSFEKRLGPEEFPRFLSLYRKLLLEEIGTGPYLYTFKRLLLWGRKNA